MSFLLFDMLNIIVCDVLYIQKDMLGYKAYLGTNQIEFPTIKKYNIFLTNSVVHTDKAYEPPFSLYLDKIIETSKVFSFNLLYPTISQKFDNDIIKYNNKHKHTKKLTNDLFNCKFILYSYLYKNLSDYFFIELVSYIDSKHICNYIISDKIFLNDHSGIYEITYSIEGPYYDKFNGDLLNDQSCLQDFIYFDFLSNLYFLLLDL